MTAIAKLLLPAAAPGAGIAAAIAKTLAWGVRQFATRIRNRRDLARLARFDDRLLADIGLTRGDLRGAVCGSLWDDTTLSLRARALEQRLSRNNIEIGLKLPVSSPPLAPCDDVVTPLSVR